MSYIQRSSTNAGVTPFDIGKMSGNTAVSGRQIFDTFNASWISVNTSTGAITANDAFFTEACFSPNSNTYGLGRVGNSGASTYIQGQILPESSTTSAGGSGRGDDIAYYYSASQYPEWLYVGAITSTPDTDLTHLKVMRL